MATITDFQFFDPTQEYTITYGDLPHWEQPGATYFITFRTEDSLPRAALDLWQRERDDWLTRRIGLASNIPRQDKLKSLAANEQQQFHRLFRHKLEQQLDRGMGECPFVDLQLAQIVANSLKHFDGKRYHLGDFIVMPNHVHLLVCLFPEFQLRRQCYSWKHYSAIEINKIRQTTGVLWQTESFDHLVRDAEHFKKFQTYIRSNPDKAGLSDGKYLLYDSGV